MQVGSLHVVIIVVLFVALMAALGTVFYQNFIAKKQVVVETNTSVDVKPLTTRVAFDSDIYSLDYSKDWNSETKKIESSTAGASVTTLTSHDGSVQASFTVSEKRRILPVTWVMG
jgi:Tfp pilus assembly major pilin PilA